MKEYGLIGHPLGHSFSRKFFTEKFREEGLDAVYHNFDLSDVSMLRDVVMTHPDLEGLNCTIPYKESVLPLLDEVSEGALRIGAVNVIKILRGDSCVSKLCGKGVRLVGYNSDVVGFAESISPCLAPCHKHALILGTGGAAKAVRVGLEELGLECRFVSRRGGEDCFAYEDIAPELLSRYLVVVNCTPVGMYPHVDEAPPLPYDALSERHLLYDLIYNPSETLFLKKGAAAGAITKNGLEMLERQALASWEFWTQVK